MMTNSLFGQPAAAGGNGQPQGGNRLLNLASMPMTSAQGMPQMPAPQVPGPQSPAGNNPLLGLQRTPGAGAPGGPQGGGAPAGPQGPQPQAMPGQPQPRPPIPVGQVSPPPPASASQPAISQVSQPKPAMPPGPMPHGMPSFADIMAQVRGMGMMPNGAWGHPQPQPTAAAPGAQPYGNAGLDHYDTLNRMS